MTDDVRAARFGLDEIARPVCWAILTPAEEADELDKLTYWVTWLRERYHLDQRTLPGCWTDHGDVVEELSALRTAWLHTYNGGARADTPLAWHTHLQAARGRLRDVVADAGCRPAQHHAGHGCG